MTELDNGVLYFNSENVLKFLSKEWKVLVAAVENSLKSYSAGKVVQPVRSAVPVEKNEGYLYLFRKYFREIIQLVSYLIQFLCISDYALLFAQCYIKYGSEIC